MYNEKQLVRITVFVLLVGIVLVYAVFFNLKGDHLKTGTIQAVQHFLSPSSDEGNTAGTLSGSVATSQSGQTTDETTGSTISFSGLEELFGSQSEYMGTGRHMLSGTSLYQGRIDVLQTLGINHEYILKDGTYPNLFYAYIGRDTSYNLRQIAQEFGGNTIEIISQKDIINNLYFGDRVTFVQLPQYKDVKVNVFIQIGRDLRMIQDSASQYKAHKKYIRTLFTGK